MATVDPTNVLFKIAHPDLYERNPFNLLNLPINASAKDIRRRKEDIEAAFEAGTEAEEFKHVLPLDASRKPPTLDAVHAAFDALNDPEMRIAYSLFWFWPEEGSKEHDSRSLLETNADSMSAKWADCAKHLPQGTERTICRHNLAVFHHLMALYGERGLLDSKSDRISVASTRNKHQHWNNAIVQWNLTAKDVDAWHIVADIVMSLNDPRLDYRFARSLRDQFAFAFDQINVELAIAFAKDGREDEAKCQVLYMHLSQPDTDDVEGTFDDAFAGLQRQVEAIVNAAREEANKNPKEGLAKVDEILKRTKEPVQISRIIFDKGEPIRESVITTIFAGVRSCMIAYGNETKDWDGCLKRIDAMKKLAENDRQKALVAEDERIIKENKKVKDEEETCWFCKQKFCASRPCQTQTIHLWGNMRMGEQFGDVTFSKRSIEVSICQHCLIYDYPERHPGVKKLQDAGWKMGLGPSQDDIFAFYHFGQPKPLINKEVQSNKVNPDSFPQNNKHNNIGKGCLFWMIIGMTVLGVLRLVA